MQKPRRTAGFTLVELMVVLTIGILIIGLVGPQVFKQLSSAKSKTAQLQMKDLEAALDLFYLEVGRYPDTNEGLTALIQAPASVSNWNGPYLKKNIVPKDPWNNDYHYESPGQNGPYDLYSLGADNAPGGEKENADIVSWE